MSPPPRQENAFATAMVWVSRITTIAGEMVLPGLGGVWLDQRFGTSYLAFLGFVLGLTVGVWHLLLLARQTGPRSRPGTEDPLRNNRPDA